MHHPLMTREESSRVGMDGYKCMYFKFFVNRVVHH